MAEEGQSQSQAREEVVEVVALWLQAVVALEAEAEEVGAGE